MVMSSYQVKRSELVGHIHERGLMYKKPCSCCGSEKHGALEIIENISSTQNKVRFSCPMVRKKYPIMWKRNLRDLILWPTSKRFAEYHHYQEEVVRKALLMFRMYGGGRWMSNIRFLNFRDEVIQMCRKIRSPEFASEDRISKL
jgi:hypothetical protein